MLIVFERALDINRMASAGDASGKQQEKIVGEVNSMNELMANKKKTIESKTLRNDSIELFCFYLWQKNPIKLFDAFHCGILF